MISLLKLSGADQSYDTSRMNATVWQLLLPLILGTQILLIVAVAGWIQRDQQAAIVYLLEENRVLKARLRGRKLRFTDDERRRLAVKYKQ